MLSHPSRRKVVGSDSLRSLWKDIDPHRLRQYPNLARNKVISSYFLKFTVTTKVLVCCIRHKIKVYYFRLILLCVFVTCRVLR